MIYYKKNYVNEVSLKYLLVLYSPFHFKEMPNGFSCHIQINSITALTLWGHY